MVRICKRCGAIFDGEKRDINCPACRKIREPRERTATCKMCGEDFVTTATRVFYCPDCREIAKRKADSESKRRKAAGKTRKIGSVDLCEMCGISYTVESGNQKYCHSCSMKKKAEDALSAYYEKDGAEKRRQRVENRIQAAIPCAVCGTLFRPSGQRQVCCSEKCSREHAKNLTLKWMEEHPERRAELAHEWHMKNRHGRKRNKKKEPEE